MTAAVFLDRDGTLNAKPEEGAYLSDPAGLRLLPGAGPALRRINEAGWPVFLVTNQRGIARGLMSQAQAAAVNARLAQLLAAAGARLDGVYVCPHGQGECDCRKPAPGLLLRAAREHPEVELARSVMVGDTESDVAAGAAAGTRTVRLGPPGTPTTADHLAESLAAAVDWIFGGRR
ncbi:MAG: D-glycero-alpha-D-manno-heptose-1,7-bisphosphate 7-phosphatase [Mycobacteriales bacterium]